MEKLETQYKNYLKGNPDSKYTYDEWLVNVFFQKYNYNDEELEEMKLWEVTLFDGLEDEREIEFKETATKISNHLKKLKNYNGDISDIGNEVGYAIGSILENMTDSEINSFITGFIHGVSLTNGTH